MKFTNYIYDLASRVNSLSFQAYLIQRGWRKVVTRRPEIAVIVSPNDNPEFDLQLPLNRTFKDYDESIFDAVKKVAKYEDRDEIQIINDLIAPPADIVRYRVENSSTQNGLIPLKAGFELLESAKKSLLSAASDLFSPTLFHKRMSYKQATQFIDSCLLGQTERGSYIASIVCPFIKITNDDRAAQLTLFSGEDALLNSVTREVTKKLMGSIQKVKNAVESGEYEILEDPSSDQVISVNFMESIVEINEFTFGSVIEISTTWAPTIPIPSNVPSKIQITNDHIEPIKSIIERLKPDTIETQGDYVGKISAVEANPDVRSRQDGVITFVFINDEGKAVSAKVTLSADEIHQATQAFDQGKNIRVTGNLKVSSRQKIIEPSSFNIIE